MRNFFVDLIKRQTPLCPANRSRRRLAAVGDSLTEEEAVERIRKDEEERKRKGEKTAQKAEAHKRKRE